MKHKRILIALLVCCFCFGLLLSPPAHAAGVASTVALVGTLAMSMPVISQLAAMAMDAANMTPALRVAAAEADTPMQAFIQRTFTDFCERNALAVGTVLRIASIGAKYYQDGSISFDQNLSDLFGGYMDWLWSSDGGDLLASSPSGIGSSFVQIDTTSVPSDRLVHPDYTYNLYPMAGTQLVDPTYGVISTFTESVYCMRGLTQAQPRFGYVWAVSDSPFYEVVNGSNQAARSYTWDGTTYYFRYNKAVPTNVEYTGPGSSAYNGPTNILNPWDSVMWDVAYLVYHGTVIGGSATADTGILNLPENKDINILKPQDKMDNIPDFGPAFDAGATVSIADYLQSVMDGLETGDYSLPTTDAATGESAGTIEGEMSQTQAMERVQTLTSDLAAPGVGIVTDTAPADLGPYTLDLTAYFPFCIPWDIAAMISYLQATPEAPHFEWTLNVPNLVNYTFAIDLAVFDPVASVLRQMELLAFAVGLAAATKSLIQGGD